MLHINVFFDLDLLSTIQHIMIPFDPNNNKDQQGVRCINFRDFLEKCAEIIYNPQFKIHECGIKRHSEKDQLNI